MKFSDVVVRVSRRTGYPLNETKVICSAFIHAVTEMLLDGHEVQLPRLGRFAWRVLGPRSIFNPKTKEMVSVPARRRLHFRAGKVLRKGLK